MIKLGKQLKHFDVYIVDKDNEKEVLSTITIQSKFNYPVAHKITNSDKNVIEFYFPFN